MNEYWNKQGIIFIWITDGAGWKSTHKPLREYFDKADYLLNLEISCSIVGGVTEEGGILRKNNKVLDSPKGDELITALSNLSKIRNE